ncbi:hypothetical protein M405DRAFT_829510 [Rhizopogon salebrosus TDB-379]|nr:hypothetical protein M405DRAFT_829510 [Rhizopogon salebrosus TDB-379]
MCLIIPRPSSGTMARSTRVGSVWKQLQRCECVSPSIDPTQPDATFRALYYYNLIPTLTTLATATCSTGTCSQYHLPLPPQAQSPRFPCLLIPDP